MEGDALITKSSFSKTSEQFWNKAVQQIGSLHASGHIKAPSNYCILYPQSLLVTETPTHFIMELIGAKKVCGELKVGGKNKSSSTNLYFNQFEMKDDDCPVFSIPGHDNSMEGLLIMPAGTEEKVVSRYPRLIDRFPSRLVYLNTTRCVDIAPTATRVCFKDCTFIDAQDEVVRARQITLSIAISKSDSLEEYVQFLNSNFLPGGRMWPSGVIVVEQGGSEAVLTAGQLSNLFLMDKLHETQLGKFLEEHDEILTSALHYVGTAHEVAFGWQEGNPDPSEESIRPDLMLKRVDGKWDICDIKVGFLEKKTLTHGRRRRRMLSRSVVDGLSQLGNYRDYFLFQANRTHAAKRHGIEVDDPKLILIIGTGENLDKLEMREAMRIYDKKLEIIDWDTLLQLYLVNNGVGVADSSLLSGRTN